MTAQHPDFYAVQLSAARLYAFVEEVNYIEMSDLLLPPAPPADMADLVVRYVPELRGYYDENGEDICFYSPAAFDEIHEQVEKLLGVKIMRF